MGNEFQTDSNGNDKLSFSRYKRASGLNSLGGIEEGDGEKRSKFKQEGEGPSIGGSDTKTIEENVEKEKKKENNVKNLKKVLYISDYLLRSPLYFHKTLAKILSEKYMVDFLVYDLEFGLEIISENLKIIHLPINIKKQLNSTALRTLGRTVAYLEFCHSRRYYFLGIYAELLANDKFTIGGNEIGIRDYLQEQNYSFGIADFDIMAAPFAVFEALGIEKTFNMSSSIFFPQYLQFLDIEGNPIDVTQYQIPDSCTASPEVWKDGVAIYQKNTDQYDFNLKQLKLSSYWKKILLHDTCKDIFEAASLGVQPPNMEVLFKKIKLHFVNQHPLEKFKTFPLNEKIIYIGGIHVEEKKILTEKIKKLNPKRRECIVLVSFGTVRVSGELNRENIEIMFDRFNRHSKCKFIVRIEEHLLPENYNKSKIKVTDKFINQQEILSEKNTKLFITHCGQHSLIEAIYAGVPLICIPNSFDQFYNSSIVEYLGIGIYVKMLETDQRYDSEDKNLKFEYDFKRAFNEIFTNDKYQEAADNLRENIISKYYNGNKAKDVLFEKISEVIGD